MPGRECIRLHNHRRTRLTIVAACCNCHHIAALHRASNSETDSVHRIAANSSDRSKPATCLATRLRTAFERASGTTSRNSRKPRARRRSRIAFIRSAVCAMVSLHSVTRYTVTRYGPRIKRCVRRVRLQPSGSRRIDRAQHTRSAQKSTAIGTTRGRLLPQINSTVNSSLHTQDSAPVNRASPPHTPPNHRSVRLRRKAFTEDANASLERVGPRELLFRQSSARSLSEYSAWPRPWQTSPQASRSRRGWVNTL